MVFQVLARKATPSMCVPPSQTMLLGSSTATLSATNVAPLHQHQKQYQPPDWGHHWPIGWSSHPPSTSSSSPCQQAAHTICHNTEWSHSTPTHHWCIHSYKKGFNSLAIPSCHTSSRQSWAAPACLGMLGFFQQLPKLTCHPPHSSHHLHALGIPVYAT